MLDSHHILRIKVLEDSAECGVFVISVYCEEPLLLQFWCTKPPFRSAHVEQMDVRSQAVAEMDFVLRVLHRAPNLPNSHYWGPFVLALCLDALPFRFRLPAEADDGSKIQEILKGGGELTLLRWEASNYIFIWKRTSSSRTLLSKMIIFLYGHFSDSILSFKCLCVRFQAWLKLWSLTPIHPGLLCTSAQRQNRHNITGLTAHTIVGSAPGAFWWAKHTITQCGEEDERTAAGMGKLEGHSERKQGA